MRFLLSFLLSFVLIEAQTYAQDTSHIASNGGPNYGSAASLVGTYGGVLVATSETDSSVTETDVTTTDQFGNTFITPQVTTQPPTTVTPNALGVFTLGIQAEGISTGAFLMFASGQTFTGTIAGLANPTSQKFQGLFGASFTPTTTFSFSTQLAGTGTETQSAGTAQATASGELTATIGQEAGTSTFGSSSSQSLTGTATMTVAGNINPFGNNNFFFFGIQPTSSVVNDSFTLSVDGFQQGLNVNPGTAPTLP